jgi:tetratricopeptide (TPR) repeat protein
MLMETRGGEPSFLRLLLRQDQPAARLRRRCAVIAAAVVFLSCLFIVLGFALPVLAALGVSALLAVAFLGYRQGWDRAFVERLRSLRARPSSSAVDWPVPAGFAADATVEMAAVTPSSGRRMTYGAPPLPTRAQVSAALARLLPALHRRLHDVLAPAPAPAPAPSAPPPNVLEAEGSRCNEIGVKLRRAGRLQQAATLHEAARVIYAGVGDGRGEALAANGLGVALAELGDEDAALEQFERAQTLLRELGDPEWEGKVLANAGLAKHRVGQDDEAVDLLRTALTKLSPQSEAYRRVEQRLRRAS